MPSPTRLLRLAALAVGLAVAAAPALAQPGRPGGRSGPPGGHGLEAEIAVLKAQIAEMDAKIKKLTAPGTDVPKPSAKESAKRPDGPPHGFGPMGGSRSAHWPGGYGPPHGRDMHHDGGRGMRHESGSHGQHGGMHHDGGRGPWGGPPHRSGPHHESGSHDQHGDIARRLDRIGREIEEIKALLRR